jgi:precorrin-2 dehydrogenase/sirohydrochlorin ferrochelatase
MNQLYPIFLKTETLSILVVGGGNVALEKLHFLFKSSPNAKVLLISENVKEEIILLKSKYQITIAYDRYHPKYLSGHHIVIATTNEPETNKLIHSHCRSRNLLINVADCPPLCDFYMGGIVSKGNLKIAISTNGKSPTLAKRLKELLQDALPEEIDDLLTNMHTYRKTLSLSFEEKVSHLNELTKKLIQ